MTEKLCQHGHVIDGIRRAKGKMAPYCRTCSQINSRRRYAARPLHPCECGCGEMARKRFVKNHEPSARLTHGQTINHQRTSEYRSYQAAKARCENPANNRYPYYGGRGIRFLFTSFEQFIAEVGPKPSRKYSVDRKNTNGHYEPGNVRW